MIHIEKSQELIKFKNNLLDIVKSNTIDILINISKDYNIPIDELMKYIDIKTKLVEKKKKENTINKCCAKINNGNRCSRKALKDIKFCKKHSENQTYGIYIED